MTDEHFDCGDAIRRLWEYLDGELSDRDHRKVDEHLAFCLRCCGELEFSRQLRGVLQEPSTKPLPEDARHRLEDFIDDLDDSGNNDREEAR